ncbi:tyrosine-type recombinase/integrase [Halobacterium litoreum]|uniref:Tyrosine-type recombinase/integrase n=1 Tax=Halobacterium litoreum TaxID=2039234 RepID=A0ABD5NBK1_9EURY|nr:tyrosine-type recombinase/integrase [Halobacterium litoreum]UHH14816.1 site-specific integrase [Halobacterium litoreum]
MQMEDHNEDDGRKVWLTEEEADQFLDAADDTQQCIAFGLGLRCGLRCKEIVDATPRDVTDGPAGTFLRVEHGKGGKYRETPLPQDLATTIQTVGDLRDEPDDVPLVDVSTRTVERWVESARDDLAEHEDDGWTYLTPHDLRRTWGTLLCEREVEPGLVMEYGGWEDWDTFREHYLGQYSVKAQQRAREKVPWL